MSAYCSAKAGLSMLTQVAALEMGPRGIRVNAVSPGFVDTPLTEGSYAVPGLVEDYVENTALGRAGKPEEIADAVVFLCSPKSSWLTGEVLDLNGGAHLKRYPDVLGSRHETGGGAVMSLLGEEPKNMSFGGKQAIVTGAGSGIGAALCRALVGAGADVVCTDIDGDAAERTASALGGSRDGPPASTSPTPQRCRRPSTMWSPAPAGLDLMFNNAGIVWGGDTELLTLDQWNAIIDVNIRGVVHGVAAAYPQMIKQGHGHIVNTASMAGLTAAGQITSYVTTKHAVVGLSLALRSEAAAHGVGVLAVCPSAVETPILDKGAVGGFVGRNYFLQGQGVQDGIRRRPPGAGHVEGHRDATRRCWSNRAARMPSGCSHGWRLG